MYLERFEKKNPHLFHVVGPWWDQTILIPIPMLVIHFEKLLLLSLYTLVYVH